MSNSQEVPPDSWDMDSNNRIQNPQGEDPALSSANSGLSSLSLNVNAPAFVPNINAPTFVPNMIPPTNVQTPSVSSVPGYTAPVVSLSDTNVLQNGNYKVINTTIARIDLGYIDF